MLHRGRPATAPVTCTRPPAPGAWSRLGRFWVGPLDPAPLGLFRIAYGLVLLASLAELGPDLRAFFTDEGFIPRPSLAESSPGHLTLLVLSGEWWAVALFWGLSLVIALLVAVGYRTRLATALAFVVLASFHLRNPLVLTGADNVLRLMGFWLIFAPAGARFSVDAALRRARGERPSGHGSAFPVRLLQLQAAWIYLMTGLEKLPGSTWLNGSAVYYPLHHGFYGRPYAHWLADFDHLVRGATWGTLLIELAFLPAMFLPVFQPHARRLAVAGAALLQVGILVLMNVGIFPLVMLVLLVLILPPGTVRRLVVRARRLSARSHAGTLKSHPRRHREPWASSTLDGRAGPPARRTGATRARWRVAAAVALGLVAATTFATALPEWFGGGRPPSPIVGLMGAVGLSQRWTMFAPDPTRFEFWMRAPGRLADGTTVDLVDAWGQPQPRVPRPRADSPDTVPLSVPLYSRWMRVHHLVGSEPGYQAEYARMYCRLGNAHLSPGESPLETFDLYHVRRTIPRPGRPGPGAVRERHLGSYRCS